MSKNLGATVSGSTALKVFCVLGIAVLIITQKALFEKHAGCLKDLEYQQEELLQQKQELASVLAINAQLVKQTEDLVLEVASAKEKANILEKMLTSGGDAASSSLLASAKSAIAEKLAALKLNETGKAGLHAPVNSGTSGKPEVLAAVVIMACNRPAYLERTIKALLKHHSSPTRFPLFLFQDGADAGVAAVASNYKDKIHFVQHVTDEPVRPHTARENPAYYRIARHYKFTLGQLFDGMQYPRVIILEDDMEIAPDFFSLFKALAPILDADTSLMAVSSWNDNGQEKFVRDPARVFRSDFFPGLGWMMTRRLWAELGPIWPDGYWDDWMRLASTRKGRQFLFPEMCRNFNFGEHGSSGGQFYQQYLAPIKVPAIPVNFSELDLSYLTSDNYPRRFWAELAAAEPVPAGGAHLEASKGGDGAPGGGVERSLLVEYTNERHFGIIARQFGIFEEWKDGIPRASYAGVVSFHYDKSRVFLAPAGIRAKIAAFTAENS